MEGGWDVFYVWYAWVDSPRYMVSMIQTAQNEAVEVDGLDEVTQETTYNE